MKNFIPTLLLIPVCALPVRAYCADAPAGALRIAEISALATTARAQTLTRIVATEIELRPSTLGAAAPPVAALPTAIPYRSATPRKVAVPARAALDLRPPDLGSLPLTPQDNIPAESDEPQAVAVVAAPSQPQDNSNTSLSLSGIGSLYWAARHPAQAWRVVLPIQPGDEFDAHADIGRK